MTVDPRRARALAALPEGDFRALLDGLTPAQQRAALVHRLRYDRATFCRFMWPERFSLDFSALHRSLFARSDVGAWDERAETVRDAVAAPRGYAKSTISSFAELVHAIVYDLEAYIILLSAGQRLSFSLSRDLRNAFQAKDTPLARLYGPFDVTGVQGEWEVSVNGRPSVAVLAASFGSEVRGAKHPTRGIRPTLVVIDDGEKKDRVRNPEQRQVWWDFLTKDVLKLGRREGGTVYRVRGTVLHTDSMLARLMHDPGWQSERWKAIVSWPTRADLWERCGAIWKDLTLGEHRRAAALAFYRANQADMDEGAEVLDPAAESIFDLYEQIWAEGLASFLQEKQNDPVDPSTQLFPRLSRYRLVDDPAHGPSVERLLDDGTPSGRRTPVSELRKVGRWDPATGTPHGDYAAIAILGRDRWGYTYVLALWMRRAKPSEQLDAAWTLAERWGVSRISLESNGFQDLAVEQFPKQKKERREAGRFWQLTILEQASTDDKEARISTLEPDITNGWLLFPEGLSMEATQQFTEFPTSQNDDAPDAVHGAWKLLGGTPVSMGRERLQ